MHSLAISQALPNRSKTVLVTARTANIPRLTEAPKWQFNSAQRKVIDAWFSVLASSRVPFLCPYSQVPVKRSTPESELIIWLDTRICIQWSTDMHQGLQLAEILYHIVSQVPSACNDSAREDDVNPQIQATDTYIALAQTCKYFYEPAMDSLWGKIYNLEPILSRLPKANEKVWECAYFLNPSR